MASTRYSFVGMGVFWPIFMYWGFTRAVPRKLYTDVICETGNDGAYVREVLRTRKPGLWAKVSKQLFDNKFNFPEMNEFKGNEFGWGFVDHRVY
jgi:hypothetical protein